MKKMSNKGFTLIELLAVITIMGILMMVAIPSVSRTIENSRRDTFADNVRTYINTVRNAALADELKCYSSANSASDTAERSYSATPDGYYFYRICTIQAKEGSDTLCTPGATEDLMETVAKSSWGSADLYGVVMWHKYTSTSGTKSQKTDYSAVFADTALHGMNNISKELSIKRSTILTSGALAKTDVYKKIAEVDNQKAYECVIDGASFNTTYAGVAKNGNYK